LALNLDDVFSRPNQIVFSDANSTTHSRTNDVLADQLCENIARAFTLISSGIGDGVDHLADKLPGTPSEVLIATNATPYRLTVSQFFPRPSLPLDNPLTEQGVELGRRLFNEPLLSSNNKQSCASCHQPKAAFADAGKAASLGAEGQRGTRNAMGL